MHDFTKLTTIAYTEYTSLIMRGQWPSSPKAVIRKRSIDNIVALKSELKRKEKIIKLFKSLTPSSFLKQPYHSTSCHTNKDSKYNSKGNLDHRLKAQVGKGKDFATRAEFFAWKHTPPKNNSTYCICNGL
eukprot:14604280-Ditylum_brightwellii.AAC.1